MRSNRGIWVLIATVALVAPAHQAQAQPAEAFGKPLPEATLRDGTVSVRVVAGDKSKPVSGTDVTLMTTPADGTSPTSELRARTDSDGRASFSNVAPDAMVQARVTGEAGEMSSSRFPMPAAGGIKLILSTLPIAGTAMPPMGGGGGPMAGGAGGPMAGGPMMSPRAASGTPRPQPGDAPDTITVRLSYDDLADPTPPKDHPVLLIGYRFDLAVAGKVIKSDAIGRAAFDGLDRRGATSYFAMTLLPRGDDFDRLVSEPLMLGGDAGLRLMLSGDKRSVGVAVDDQGKLDPQPPGSVPPGEVRVALAGVIQPGDKVELVDALTGKVLVTTKATPPAPNADSSSATWGTGADDPVLAIGALAISVGANGAPAEGATVEVRRRTPVTPPPANPGTAGSHGATHPPNPPPASGPPRVPPAPAVAEARWSATVGANGDAAITGMPVGVEARDHRHGRRPGPGAAGRDLAGQRRPPRAGRGGVADARPGRGALHRRRGRPRAGLPGPGLSQQPGLPVGAVHDAAHPRGVVDRAGLPAHHLRLQPDQLDRRPLPRRARHLLDPQLVAGRPTCPAPSASARSWSSRCPRASSAPPCARTSRRRSASIRPAASSSASRCRRAAWVSSPRSR